MNKKNIIIIISILVFIMLVGGISYSYFFYENNIGDVSLTTGEISIDLSGVNGNQVFSNIIPMDDSDGKISTSYFDFSVDATVDTERIYYEIYLLPDSENTLDSNYLKIYLTDQSNNELKNVTIYNNLGDSEIENGKVIYKGIIEVNQNGTTRNESNDFRLRLWLDESFSGQTSKVFDFDIYLYAKNVDTEFELPYGANLIRKAIEEKEAAGGSCSTITWTDTEDNITYLSGTNNCVDMNYVWYSGKLWRITAIYPDGTMKMVTKNAVTSIGYNASNLTNFYTDANTTSYVYQWLNEDFYDTLYNPSYFINTSKEWNATSSEATSTNDIVNKLSETTMVSANVGLLNSFEYFNSYRCASSSSCDGLTNSPWASGFLKTTFYFWLLNPYAENNIWRVLSSGSANGGTTLLAYGLHPAIYLKPNVEFTGNGTSSSPYHIVGDKVVGTANQKINTRLSGEYVRLQSGNTHQDFRIVNIEDNKTKIVALDYADSAATKAFATANNDPNNIWGSAASMGSGTWYTYLNDPSTGYLANLKSIYGNGLFDSGLYYYGQVYYYDYKLAVCVSSYTGTIKTCQKTTSQSNLDIGLLRYGEMFATQFVDSNSSAIQVWLLNRYMVNQIWYIQETGRTYSSDYATDLKGAYPTVHLSSDVIILSGKGTKNNPYVVGLQ